MGTIRTDYSPTSLRAYKKLAEDLPREAHISVNPPTTSQACLVFSGYREGRERYFAVIESELQGDSVALYTDKETMYLHLTKLTQDALNLQTTRSFERKFQATAVVTTPTIISEDE